MSWKRHKAKCALLEWFDQTDAEKFVSEHKGVPFRESDNDVKVEIVDCKEPVMSEFKVGDQIVKKNPNIKHAHIRTVIAITKNGGAVLDYSGYGYKAPRVRHATPEEIAAGHRIDKPSDSGELETLDKLENHISPNCEVKNG